MDVYAEVATEVEPKKVKLAELNAELEAAHAVLKSKQVMFLSVEATRDMHT